MGKYNPKAEEELINWTQKMAKMMELADSEIEIASVRPQNKSPQIQKKQNKTQKTEVISCIFSDHTMKLEINCKKNTRKAEKYTEKPGNTQTLNNMLLNNDWVNQEIKTWTRN